MTAQKAMKVVGIVSTVILLLVFVGLGGFFIYLGMKSSKPSLPAGTVVPKATETDVNALETTDLKGAVDAIERPKSEQEPLSGKTMTRIEGRTLKRPPKGQMKRAGKLDGAPVREKGAKAGSRVSSIGSSMNSKLKSCAPGRICVSKDVISEAVETLLVPSGKLGPYNEPYAEIVSWYSMELMKYRSVSSRDEASKAAVLVVEKVRDTLPEGEAGSDAAEIRSSLLDLAQTVARFVLGSYTSGGP